MNSSRTVLSMVLLGLVATNVGCANLLWNLQPYRLQRLNRCPAPSLDPEFSYRAPSKQPSLANQVPASDASKVSGNTATVSIVRAQSQE